MENNKSNKNSKTKSWKRFIPFKKSSDPLIKNDFEQNFKFRKYYVAKKCYGKYFFYSVQEINYSNMPEDVRLFDSKAEAQKEAMKLSQKNKLGNSNKNSENKELKGGKENENNRIEG